MKIRIKNSFIKLNIVSVAVCSLLLLASCTGDFSDINKDPNAATEEELGYDNLGVGSLITQMQHQIYPCVTKDQNIDVNNYQKMFSLAGDVYSGHQGASNMFNNNGRNNTTYDMTPDWYSTAYTIGYQNYMTPWHTLLKKKSISPEAFAVGQILKVFGMHRITDMYGPIPYKNFVPISNVPFNSQEDVYDTFFNELDEAVEILQEYIKNNPGARSLVDYDKIYSSDFNKWILFANSLKLRLALRLVYVDGSKAQAKAEKAIAAGVFTTNEDNAMISVTGTSTVNPLAKICYEYNDTRLGATMESYLKGYKDPRLEKLFDESEVSNRKEYNGIRNGSNFKGNEYKVFSTLKVTHSTPIQVMTAAEVFFLRAEVALRGWNAGGPSAKELYEQGINTAFDHTGAGNAAAYIEGTTLPEPYVDPMNSKYDYSKTGQAPVKWEEDKGLEQIITQKWIALYPDGQEAWSEFRRTGYPLVIPVGENFSGSIDTRKQIARLPYPNNLKIDYPLLYPEALSLLGGADTGATKLWWDRNTYKPYQ